MPIKILDVGQCGIDGPRMAARWRDELGATVDDSASKADALRRAAEGGYDLILVNRVLAGSGASGMEVIQALVESGSAVPVMLVSDLDEAQDAAVALGATRGFGKADLGKQSTLEVVARVASGGRA